MANLPAWPKWLDNTPYYPIYKNGFLKQFIDTHGGDLGRVRMREEVWVIENDDESFPCELNEYSLASGLEGNTIQISTEDIEDKIAFVAVFSDGVTQIDEIPWQESVESFLSFKKHPTVFFKISLVGT